MRILKWAAALILAVFCSATSAFASVSINIDMSTQTMHVRAANGEDYDWPVSTAGRGYFTPRGTFGVQSMQVMHRSHKYHNSPMPHSIFFRGGFAIHGTYSERNLGHPASHGCVRLSRAHAATLFALVKRDGGARIVLTGAPPSNRMLAVDGHHKRRVMVAAYHKHTRVMVAARHHKYHRTAIASNHHKHHRTMMANAQHQHAPLAYAPARHPRSLLEWLTSPGI